MKYILILLINILLEITLNEILSSYQQTFCNKNKLFDLNQYRNYIKKILADIKPIFFYIKYTTYVLLFLHQSWYLECSNFNRLEGLFKNSVFKMTKCVIDLSTARSKYHLNGLFCQAIFLPFYTFRSSLCKYTNFIQSDNWTVIF